MRKVVIDTNALISCVTDRNPTQQEAVARVFDEASRLKCSVICPQHVLTEFVYVMDRVYGVAKTKIATMVADFGDAIVAAVCAATPGAAVLTFDDRFRKALKRVGIPVDSPPPDAPRRRTTRNRHST